MKVKLMLEIGIACLLLSGTLAGCRYTAASLYQGPEKQVSDSRGRTVPVPVHPERIVSIGVSTDDILIPVVGTERIAAISGLPPNLPKESKKIKGRVTDSPESVIACSPDLVIVPDWKSADYTDEIRAVGIPVFEYHTPSDAEGMIRLIDLLGDVVNEKQKAKALADRTSDRLKKLDDFVSAIPEHQRKTAVLYTVNGLSGGQGSSFESLCRRAGLEDGAASWGIAAAAGGNREAMVNINPDIIFLPSDDYTQDQKGNADEKRKEILEDPSYQGIKAVRNQAIYIVDAKWIMSYSEFMVSAMETMAKDAYGYKVPQEASLY